MMKEKVCSEFMSTWGNGVGGGGGVDRRELKKSQNKSVIGGQNLFAVMALTMPW